MTEPEFISRLINVFEEGIQRGLTDNSMRFHISPILYEYKKYSYGEGVLQAFHMYEKFKLSSDRYFQMIQNIKFRPFWQYKLLNEPVNEIEGIIIPADDLIWDVLFPPNGWMDQSWIRPLNKAEAEKYSTRELPQILPIDPGYRLNPGKADWMPFYREELIRKLGQFEEIYNKEDEDDSDN